MALALQTFHSEKGAFPPGLGAFGDQTVQKSHTAFNTQPIKPANLRFASWYTWIMPYVDGGALYSIMRQTQNQGGPVPTKEMNYIFTCPSEPRSDLDFNSIGVHATGSYAGVAGASQYEPGQSHGSGIVYMDGILHWRSRVTLDQVLDGTAYTAII